LSPTQSQYFNLNTGLNTAANLQNEANTFSSRVSVRAAFGYPQDMVFYTLTPGYGQTLARARYITFVLADALYNYYEYDMDPDDPYYYDLHDYAYLWGNVALDMQDIDLWWLDEIGALQGFDNYGDALYIDSDGILPITTQQPPWVHGAAQHLLHHTHARDSGSRRLSTAVHDIRHGLWFAVAYDDVVDRPDTHTAELHRHLDGERERRHRAL
jgi:hypothetical protein